MNRIHCLGMAVAAGIVMLGVPPAAHAGDVILTGNVLKVGISDGGSLIDSAFTVGINQSPAHNGVFPPYDFLKPGDPFEFYSVGANGAHPTPQGAGYYAVNRFGGTTTNTSSGTMLSTSTTGMTWGDLAWNQSMSFGQNGGFIDFSVTLTNTGNATLGNVVYARGLDPDQDVYAGGGYSTNNTIVNGNLVTGSAPLTDWTIGIFSDSLYPHTPSITAAWDTNPYTLLNPVNDGNGDYTINMAWNLGSLDPGASKTVTFQYRVAETSGEVVNPGAVPDAGSTLLLLGVALSGLAGFSLHRKHRA